MALMASSVVFADYYWQSRSQIRTGSLTEGQQEERYTAVSEAKFPGRLTFLEVRE